MILISIKMNMSTKKEILLKHINQFSESTLAQLEKDQQHVFYVYCLMDPK